MTTQSFTRLWAAILCLVVCCVSTVSVAAPSLKVGSLGAQSWQEVFIPIHFDNGGLNAVAMEFEVWFPVADGDLHSPSPIVEGIRLSGDVTIGETLNPSDVYMTVGLHSIRFTIGNVSLNQLQSGEALKIKATPVFQRTDLFLQYSQVVAIDNVVISTDVPLEIPHVDLYPGVVVNMADEEIHKLRDTDGDGIADQQEIKQGSDPADGLGSGIKAPFIVPHGGYFNDSK